MIQFQDVSPKPLVATIPEAMKAIRIGRTALYGLINSGSIRVVRYGRTVRIPVSELERFVAEQVSGAA